MTNPEPRVFSLEEEEAYAEGRAAAYAEWQRVIENLRKSLAEEEALANRLAIDLAYCIGYMQSAGAEPPMSAYLAWKVQMDGERRNVPG